MSDTVPVPLTPSEARLCIDAIDFLLDTDRDDDRVVLGIVTATKLTKAVENR